MAWCVWVESWGEPRTWWSFSPRVELTFSADLEHQEAPRRNLGCAMMCWSLGTSSDLRHS